MRYAILAALVLTAAVVWAACGPMASAASRPTGPAAAPAPPAPSAPQDLPGTAPPPAKAPAPPAPAAEVPAPAEKSSENARPPVTIEDLKSLYNESSLIVQFQVDSVQAKPEIAPRLLWEVRGSVMEVVKGNLLPGVISVHVDSVVRTFEVPRTQIEGKQFLASLRPLAAATERRFQLVGPYAFNADGQEAQNLRQLTEADMAKGAGGAAGLELTVRALGPGEKVFAVAGPKMIEARLTNNGEASATYLQQPIMEKGGKLYLTGQGMLRIRDTTGRVLPDKGTVLAGQMPPPPPTPTLVLPKATFTETVDLAKYFDLSEGRYTLVLALATPDSRSKVTSNGFSFQVGAVNLPEPTTKRLPPSTEAPVAVVREKTPPEKGPGEKAPPEPAPPEKSPLEPSETAMLPTPRPPKPAPQVPDPAKYLPGKATAGLVGLLRPAKAKFVVGEAVDVEFRLINEGPRTVAIDARLERTLTIQVQTVGDSPQPLVIRQVIPWAGTGPAMPEERAYLREGAFWGRTINVNTLFGKNLEEFPAPTPEEITAGKNFSYERFGKNLFGFPRPGVYTITATYVVARPRPAEGAPPAEQPKEWWVGDLQTNPVTIQIAEPGK